MGGERRRHSLTCTGTTPAVTFPPTCPAHFAAGGEGSAGWQSGEGGQGKVWGTLPWDGVIHNVCTGGRAQQ